MSGSPPSGTGTHRARLYRTLRTAHLEQALELSPATIVYRDRRYDFDEGLASRLELVRTGTLGAALWLARSGVTELEINEPLMRYSVRGTALAVAAVGLRSWWGGPRTTVVSYGIENLDPFARRAGSPRARASARLDRLLTRFVWSQTDRMVYGTPSAKALYQATLASRRGPGAEALVLPLPQECRCPAQPRDPSRVVFLGAFSHRKGFSMLREAWPTVLEQRPSASIVLLGKGPLEPLARSWAQEDRSVRLLLDPARTTIHEWLRRGQVLVLPSQPQPRWREQVGRPITEALSHGCSIVTTTETGLAPWLESRGHSVLAPGADAARLAAAVVHELDTPRTAREVLSSLPERDGRLAADDWLFDAGASRPPSTS